MGPGITAKPRQKPGVLISFGGRYVGFHERGSWEKSWFLWNARAARPFQRI